jgi:hypothetical protein
MIESRFLGCLFPTYVLAIAGIGGPENKIKCPWGTGSARRTPASRRKTRRTNPKEGNLMGLIMTRVG